MIKSENGGIRFHGRPEVICAEMEECVRGFIEMLTQHFDEELALNTLDSLVEMAKRPREEVDAECRKIVESHPEEFAEYLKNREVENQLKEVIFKAQEACMKGEQDE